MILTEKANSVVYFYSTETVNYQQRVEAFQFNEVARKVKKMPEVKDLVNFYSYDTGQNGFPSGIQHMSIPPPDLTGDRAHEFAGLPAIYIFPSGHKSVPFTKFKEDPSGSKILSFIMEKSTQFLHIDLDEHEELGFSEIDKGNFMKLILAEGVMQLGKDY